MIIPKLMKATEQNVSVDLFIMLYKMILTFESVEEIHFPLLHAHLNPKKIKSYIASWPSVYAQQYDVSFAVL